MQSLVRRMSMSKDDASTQQSPRASAVQNENEQALKDMCDMQRTQLEASRTELDELRAENEALRDELENVPHFVPRLFSERTSPFALAHRVFIVFCVRVPCSFAPDLLICSAGEERSGVGPNAAAHQAPAWHRAQGICCGNRLR